MKSLWNDKEAKQYLSDPLQLRVYTSQLLGREPDLVLHGGGNTSVKINVSNIFGETEAILYVKGSGWDLATIQAAGFAPVKMDVLLKMARLKELTDTEMVKWQRAAMIDPSAPNPSVEAILHAIIPYKFVDHTHADCVVTITNTPDGEKRIRDIYGDRMIYVPYVMPGFILARKVFEMTQKIDWKKYDGIILLNHGIFTFDDDGRESYERMIHLVSKAERYLHKHKAVISVKKTPQSSFNKLLEFASIRQLIAQKAKTPMLARLNRSQEQLNFASISNISSIATRGPLTPDHVIRTKRIAAILGKTPQNDIAKFAEDYRKYFNRYAKAGMTMLDPAPRWAAWKNEGVVLFGTNVSDLEILTDITNHTIRSIQSAERLGGWTALPPEDIFDVEYWDLEQAKLKKAGKAPSFAGKVALVTGAASGIGKATVEMLAAQGAAVVALDINPQIKNMFTKKGILGIVCDVTKEKDIAMAIQTTILNFGGLDILVSNAGIFPPGEHIENLKADTWQKSIDINLTSHERLLKACIPYLKLGLDPAVVIVASKNVLAPGPGAAAYSVAKAGLTQMARVAALELASYNVRVNVIHPNQVFDTAIWTDEVLKNRAAHYKMTVEEYKTNNLLKVEITSKDVASLICTMAGQVFAKTTGAQIPIDGGNDRVI